MKRLSILLAAFFAIVTSAAALAAPVPAGTVVKAPDWVTGSEWNYSDGYALKVTSVSPQGVVFDRLDAPGQWFSRKGFLRKDAASASATRTSIYHTIPDPAGLSLTAGHPLTFQREYLSNGKLLVHATSWSVEGRETITVPAGTFDCWVIVWRTRSMRSDWTGFERWWYSPQVQNYVRMEFKYGPTPDGSRVLMRYHLGPQAAADTPVAAAPVRAVEVAPAIEKPAVAAAPAPVPVKAAEVAPALPQPQAAAAAPPAPAPDVAAVPQKADAAVSFQAGVSAVSSGKAQAVAPSTAKAEKRSRPSQPASVRPVKNAQAAPPPEPKEKKTAVKAEPVKLAENQPPPAPRPAPARHDDKVGAWHAQVGSSKDAAAMRASLARTIADNPAASSLPSGIAAHSVGGRGTFYRAWLGAYDSAREATALCQSLNMHRPGCAVFKNATVEARAD